MCMAIRVFVSGLFSGMGQNWFWFWFICQPLIIESTKQSNFCMFLVENIILIKPRWTICYNVFDWDK